MFSRIDTRDSFNIAHGVECVCEKKQKENEGSACLQPVTIMSHNPSLICQKHTHETTSSKVPETKWNTTFLERVWICNKLAFIFPARWCSGYAFSLVPSSILLDDGFLPTMLWTGCVCGLHSSSTGAARVEALEKKLNIYFFAA